MAMTLTYLLDRRAVEGEHRQRTAGESHQPRAAGTNATCLAVKLERNQMTMNRLLLSARPRKSGDPGPQMRDFEQVALDSRFLPAYARGNERMTVCGSIRSVSALVGEPDAANRRVGFDLMTSIWYGAMVGFMAAAVIPPFPESRSSRNPK
jgi:hypothetical protein